MSAGGELEFAPFVLYRDLAGHFDVIQSIRWSGDSRFFLTASKDLTARIWSLDPEDGFEPTPLAGHREGVVDAWFTEDQESVRLLILIARAGQLTDARFILSARMEHFFNGNTEQSRVIPTQCPTLLIIDGESRRRISLCSMTQN